jgi:hypothetical protein
MTAPTRVILYTFKRSLSPSLLASFALSVFCSMAIAAHGHHATAVNPIRLPVDPIADACRESLHG